MTDPVNATDESLEQTTSEDLEPDARVEELEAEVGVLKDKLLRAVADAENVRRRADQEKREAAQYGAAALARDMIEILDNFDRAIDAAPKDFDGAAAMLLEGVRMIRKSFLTALERHGVKRFEPLGQKFDPYRHQAIAEAPSSDHEPGVVCHVAQPGYGIGDRVLRAASVVVSKGPAGEGGHVDMTA